MSIRTEGLNIKYPELKEYKNKKIILLDSAGLENPVIKDNKEDIIDNEKFREKSRDKLITELFLQNYIIQNSDILILVVGILTYSEQKLLNRIKTEIQRLKINKQFYIIHNLKTFIEVNQVKEYIDNFLLKSATFELTEGHKISTQKKEEKGIYFYEKNFSNPQIFHLIFANSNSKAGRYYNNFTLEFIEKSFIQITNLKNFDIIKTVKEHFIKISKQIIETQPNFKIEDFEDKNNILKLNCSQDIKLRECFIDELGFSNVKTNKFEPLYNYYRKDDKIIIKIEGPGNCS